MINKRPLLQTKSRIFVSYHHDDDMEFYLEFKQKFSDVYDVIYDNSVDRMIDSWDAKYVIRKIREDYISGSSCTIVLCGAETPFRKYVDWEIKATLDKEHGLIGVYLPTNLTRLLPFRLYDNVSTGYAVIDDWHNLIQSANNVQNCIRTAKNKQCSLIENSRELRQRNAF